MKKQIKVNFENPKGITLIALVITIIVLLILATVALYSGVQSLNSAKLTLFTTELKIMQTQVNSLNQKMNSGSTIEIAGTKYTGTGVTSGTDTTPGIQDIGKTIETTDPDAKKAFDHFNITDTTEKSKYKLYDQDTLKSLKIEGVSQKVLVNVEARRVISYKGLDYDGKMYYELSELPDNLYNVGHSEYNGDVPTFDIKVNQIGNDQRWQISISNVLFDGYIEKWQVKYQKADTTKKDYWNISDNLEFVVDSKGKYNIELVNGTIIGKKENIEVGITLADKVDEGTVKIGDYVNYKPDKITEPFISESQYSGTNANAELYQEDLSWRVLDVTSDKKVRLISDYPTTAKFTVNNYNGYNNIVLLLNNCCKKLYSNSKYGEARSLNIDDVAMELNTSVWDYHSYIGTQSSQITYKVYPSIFANESNCNIDGKNVENGLGINEQKEYITGYSSANTYIQATQTAWMLAAQKNNFKIDKYYEIFINRNEINYETYWLSSRCINVSNDTLQYYGRYINEGRIYLVYISNSQNQPRRRFL